MTYLDQTPTAPQEYEKKEKDTVAFGGTITNEIVLRKTKNNNDVVNIRFAMDSTKVEEKVIWGSVTYWGTQALIASDFLAKGMSFGGIGKRHAQLEVFQREDGTISKTMIFDGLALFLDAKDMVSLIQRVVDKRLAKAPTSKHALTPAPTPALNDKRGFDISDDDIPF